MSLRKKKKMVRRARAAGGSHSPNINVNVHVNAPHEKGPQVHHSENIADAALRRLTEGKRGR